MTEHLAFPLLFILNHQRDLDDSYGDHGERDTDDESEPPGDSFYLVIRFGVDRQVAEALGLQGGVTLGVVLVGTSRQVVRESAPFAACDCAYTLNLKWLVIQIHLDKVVLGVIFLHDIRCVVQLNQQRGGWLRNVRGVGLAALEATNQCNQGIIIQLHVVVLLGLQDVGFRIFEGAAGLLASVFEGVGQELEEVCVGQLRDGVIALEIPVVVVTHELSHLLLLVKAEALPSHSGCNISSLQVILPDLSHDRVEICKSHCDQICFRELQALLLEEAEQKFRMLGECLIQSRILLGQLSKLNFPNNGADV